MTATTCAWIALLVAAGTVGVRALHPRRVRDDADWHPRVTSGCGR